MKRIHKQFVCFCLILLFLTPTRAVARHLAQVEGEIKDIRKKISDYDYAYYVKDMSDVSDDEYDALFRRLGTLEKQYPIFLAAESPTQKLGDNVSQRFERVQHSSPMYSLQKAYTTQELAEWYDDVIAKFPGKNPEFVCELKIDGLAVSLIYKNGEFVRGATRGNGLVGEDVTENLKTIKSLPLKLVNNDLTELRGEVYMPKSSYAKLGGFKHVRNAASGSLRQLDPSVTAERWLDLFIYQEENSGKSARGHYQAMKSLEVEGVRVNPNVKLCKNLYEIKEYFDYWSKNQGKLDYAIDGIVVKVNDYGMQEAIGNTSRHPKWAIALKFPEEKVATELVDVEMTVGRTGKITPVAVIEPVNIDGASISRVNLGSVDELQKLDLRKGDTVYVERTGGVIPQITGVELADRDDNAEKFVYNVNADEKTILKRKLEHWADRNCMNIQGLGTSLVSGLVDKGLVKDYADIYGLTEKNLLQIDGVKHKKTQKMLDSIQKSKTAPLANLIYALGIDGVGFETAIALADNFKSVGELSAADSKRLVAIKGIGEKTAENIVNYFKDAENQAVIQELRKYQISGI